MNKTDAVARAVGLPVDFDVRGRSIVYILVKLVEFWSRHKITLNPYLAPAISAALDTLLASIVDAMVVNPPGPD